MRFTYPGKKIAGLIIALFLVLSISGYMYNLLVLQAPDKVFWDALAADMTLPGVTCRVHKQSENQQSDQAISLDLVGKENALIRTTLVQNGTRVTTEDLNTKSTDYIRYTDIATTVKDKNGKGPDVSHILNVWAKQPKQQPAKPMLGQVALGGCIVPLVNVSPKQQQQLVAELKKTMPFQTDFTKSSRHWRWDEPYREYTVSVEPVSYITFMGHVDADFGTKALDGVSANTYKNKTPEQFIFRIGATSRRIQQIRYTKKDQSFTFSNYGVVPDTSVPAQTISIIELQKRLTALQ